MDHSWTSKGTPAHALSVSALVAPLGRWEKFCEAWAGAMERGGAKGKILHMKEFAHGATIKNSEWSGWDKARQRQLLDKLLPVVNEHVAFGVCDSYPIARWDEIPGFRADPGVVDGDLTAIRLSLQGVLEGIFHAVHPTESDPVVFFMETDDAIELDMTRQFYALTKVRGWRALPTFTPVDKGPAPLQAADMVVYEGGRQFSEQVIDKVARDPRGLYLALEKNPRLRFSFTTHEILAAHGAEILAGHARLHYYPEVLAMLHEAQVEAEKTTQRERTALGAERKKRRLDRDPPD